MEEPDLGDPTLISPDGVEALRRQLLSAINEQEWATAGAGFGDPDLSNE